MKRTLAIMLALVMVLCVLPTTAFAEEAPVKVAYTLEANEKLINVEVTITKAAKDDVEVVLNNVLADVMRNCYFMPGTKWTVNVTIKNESGKTLKYDGLHVGTLQMEGEHKTGFIGYDGYNLVLTQIAAIAFTHPAIKKLFSLTSSANIPTNDQLINMYGTLEDEGFKGDEALSDYILKYYKEQYKDDDLTWDKLVSEHLEDICKDFSDSGADSFISVPTNDELAEFEKSKLNNYLINLGSNYWQVKWPEQTLAGLTYDLFYKDFFAVLFGNEAENANPNNGCDLTRKRGVGDYEDKKGEAYQTANTYLSQLGDDGKLENGEEAQFNMALTLDGPYVGNQYASYDFLGTLSLKFNFTNPDTPVVNPTPYTPHYHTDPTPVPVIVIPPKTGDMTVWQSILHFLGIR